MLSLKVELFAGSDIDPSCRELCELANRMGILIRADFNGVELWARPNDIPETLADDWRLKLGSNRKHKIAQGYSYATK